MKFAIALVAVIGLAQADFKSGSVATYDKYTYGKFVSRMKNPNKEGTVASFYTYWDGPGFYPGGWNEIDMNVVPSVKDQPVSTNVIYGDGHNKIEDHRYADKHEHYDDNDWHTYAMEWTPHHISYHIDGHQVRKIDRDEHDSIKFMHKEQSLRMNFWTPTFHAWGADFTGEDMPWYLLFDYVEAYKYNPDTKDFDLDWRDDFNEFDQSRWHKLSGTFEANSSIFYPQNVYTSNGNLVIKMEPEYHYDHHADLIHHHTHTEHGLSHYEQEMMAHHEALPEGPSDAKKTTTSGKKEKAQIGQLQPKGEKITHQKQMKEADQHHRQGQRAMDHHHRSEPRHLIARDMESHHSRHETHHELDHKFDDQHDIEPVHFHEHSIHRTFPEYDDEHDLNLGQVSSSQTQKDSKDKQKKSTTEKKHITDMRADIHDLHHQRHQAPHSILPTVGDETPYEHLDRLEHDTDAHFWTTDHHGSLNHRLHDRYRHEAREEEHLGYGHWTAAEYEIPVHESQMGGHHEHETIHEFPLFQDHENHEIEIIPLFHQSPKHHEPSRIQYGEDQPDRRYYAHEPLLPAKKDRTPQAQQPVAAKAQKQPIKHEKKVAEHKQKSFEQQKKEAFQMIEPVQDVKAAKDVKAVKDLVQQVQQHDVTAHHGEPQHHEDRQMHYNPHYDTQHHPIDFAMHTVHEDHHALDHRFDDAQDIEPVHFHEHAVHHAFEHPDSQSYLHDPQAVEFGHEFSVQEALDHRYRAHEHEHEHLEPPLLHDFLVQEPEHEEHHETFHGREEGYMYREHLPVEHAQDHSHLYEHPLGTDFHHGETFGDVHKKEDTKEYASKMRGAHMHRDVYIEPLFDEEHESHHELDVHEIHHEPLEGHHEPIRHGAEMEYEIDETGHVFLRDQHHEVLHYLQ